MTEQLNLVQRINMAATAVGALKPDKTNTFQNYQYISADKILERCGNALASAGVLILPSIVEKVVETYTNGNKARYDATVEFIFTVTDGVTELRSPWVGMGVATDSPDKALYKAITSGHRYFLTKLLNVGVGNEDSEHEHVEPSRDTLGDVVFQRSDAGKTPPVAKPAGAPGARTHESPPHQRLFGQGASIFGPDWDQGARAWLLMGWTEKVNRSEPRSSASQLSDDEKDLIADYLRDNVKTLQERWKKYKAEQIQSTVERQPQPA